MWRKLLVLILVVLMGAIAVPVPAVNAEENPTATVTIDTGNPEVSGEISLEEVNNGLTRISGTITGLSRGVHGFHIHESGDLSDGCTSTGSHYNPFGKTHGSPSATERHVGDMGNIYADATGKAKFRIMDPLVNLTGETSVIGRAIVIHEGRDDLGRGKETDSKTTGHAGGRVGCGIIK